MKKVRFGIIGMGNMGRGHMKYFNEGEIKGAELTAVCDISADSLKWVEENSTKPIQTFEDIDQFLNSGTFDALLIATPHYDHPPLAIKGLAKGLHVLVEKPAGVYTKQVREMNEAAAKSDNVFGIMYNQRTNPLYQKLRELISSGELGSIKRFNWIITNWYRSQSYYDSGTWRATWAGEGGGVLINQCPHNLDLLQWTLGMMPSRIRAFCHFGKHREIEVEDDVTAYMEFDNGATGVFTTTVADAPGTNRYEITGDRGKIVIEDDKLTFYRLQTLESEFNKSYKGGFGHPDVWTCDVPIKGENSQHKGITQDFTNSILNGTPLLAPGEEGIHGLTLSNAMYLSTWIDNWVDLPIDEDLFHKQLQERIAASQVKKSAVNKTLEVGGTH